MVIVSVINLTSGKPIYGFRGRSDDEKPTGGHIGEYSTIEEMDTGKKLYFSNGEWKETPRSGGSSVRVVPLSVTENGTTTAPSGTAYSPVVVNVPNDDSFLIGVIERTATTGTLPSGLTKIGNNAFVSCTNLAITKIPGGVSSVGNSAFQNCKGLTSITFEGTPTFIDATAFRGCTNLLDFFVPWAEGEVENAPWGAENATIHYEHTGE